MNEEREINTAVADALMVIRADIPADVITIVTGKAREAAHVAYKMASIASADEVIIKEIIQSTVASVMEAARGAVYAARRAHAREDAVNVAALAAAEAACAVQTIGGYTKITLVVGPIAGVVAREAQKAGVSESAVSFSGALASAAFYPPDVVADMKRAVRAKKIGGFTAEEILSDKLKESLRRLVVKAEKEYLKLLDIDNSDDEEPKAGVYEQKIAVLCMAILVLNKKATLEHLNAVRRNNPQYNEQMGLFNSTTDKLVKETIQVVRELGIQMDENQEAHITIDGPR